MNVDLTVALTFMSEKLAAHHRIVENLRAIHLHATSVRGCRRVMALNSPAAAFFARDDLVYVWKSRGVVKSVLPDSVPQATSAGGPFCRLFVTLC